VQKGGGEKKHLKRETKDLRIDPLRCKKERAWTSGAGAEPQGVLFTGGNYQSKPSNGGGVEIGSMTGPP